MSGGTGGAGGTAGGAGLARPSLAALSISDLAKLVAAAVVILYSIGYVTIHLYLIQFGAEQSQFLRARFIEAGLLTALPAIVSLVQAYFLVSAVLHRDPDPDRWRRRLLSGVAVCLLPPLEFFLVLSLLGLPATVRDRVIWAVGLSLLPLLSLLAAGLGEAINRQLAVRLAGDADRGIALTAGRIVIAVGAIAAFAPYMIFVAREVFPSVPPQLAGGAPIAARLVIAHAWVAEAQQAGLDVSATQLLTPPLELIWQESDWDLVRWQTTQGPLTAQLDTEFISVVVLE